MFINERYQTDFKRRRKQLGKKTRSIKLSELSIISQLRAKKNEN